MRLDPHREIGHPRTPTRVLLVGEQWDDIKPMLRALSNEDHVAFIGPAQRDLKKVTSSTASSVVMVGPGFDYIKVVAKVVAALHRHENEDAYLPVLVCISHDDLENGNLYEDVDDFLLVPCTAAEMGKRIKRLAFLNSTTVPSSRLTVGKITLDLDTYQVTLGGQRIALAWLEFQLLKFLMENIGRIYTREQLLAHVWGVEDFGGTRTVDFHIRRLRHKLEVSGDKYFRTVKNVGYGMIHPQ
jgi:DNA-binding response OmpR family regulator